MNEELWGVRARRVFSVGASGESLPPTRDALVTFARGHITYVGPEADAPPHRLLREEWFALLTAGLVDAHTHACYVGSRHDEYVLRMAGADYRELAQRGLGIRSSHRAIAEAGAAEIESVLLDRVLRMASLGVTSVEVKSGYGLLPEFELRQLEAIARVAARRDVPRIVPTFLALHAWPSHAVAERDAYVEGQARLVDEIARRGLARFVDAYIDYHAFGVPEARLVMERAQHHGLGVRLHVGQFRDVGGAEFAAAFSAHSVDHLENVSDAGIDALAAAGVSAVLLPVASYTLGQAPPPVDRLRKAGVRMVVASDANPGTAPTESLPLAMAMALRSYGMTPHEVWAGATVNAALSLGLSTGHLTKGAPADLVAWDLPHEDALLLPWGHSRARLVLRDGAIVWESTPRLGLPNREA